VGPNKRRASTAPTAVVSAGTKSHRLLLPAMASDGDIRVLLVLDLLLSAVFASVVVWGMDVIGLVTFSLQNVILATFVLAALTYLVVLRQ
jgi:hypothetical protein